MKIDGKEVEFEFAKGKLVVDIGQAYYTTLALYDNSEGDTQQERNDSYYKSLQNFIAAQGVQISYSEAMSLDRHILVEFEEFKKKLPELPTLPSSMESTQNNSQNQPSPSSGLTLEEFARLMNNDSDSSEASSAPSDGNESSSTSPGTSTAPN